MAVYRPAEAETKPDVKYTGVVPVCLWNFTDRSSEFKWADIFLSVELDIKSSDYNRTLEICGGLEKDSDGNITGGYVLKRLYNLFDVLGFKGGVDVKGNWEDGDSKAIADIGQYLNERYQTGNPIMEPAYNHLAYLYKEQPKTPGGKAYTRVHHRLFLNNLDGQKKAEEYFHWMKTNGHLKEYTEVLPSNGAAQTVAVENL